MNDIERRLSKLAKKYVKDNYDNCYAWFDVDSYNVFVYRKSDNELADIFNIGEIGYYED